MFLKPSEQTGNFQTKHAAGRGPFLGEAALLPHWEEAGARTKGSIGFFQKRDGWSDFFFFFSCYTCGSDKLLTDSPLTGVVFISQAKLQAERGR